MTLLAPLTAALAGLLGGAVLLLIYALRARRRIVIVSTNAHWPTVDDETQAAEPFQRPRLSWLLLLHALILALLALAAGRPAIAGFGDNADRIIILDASASMRATDASGQPRFLAARELAREEASRTLDAGGRIALIALTASPTLITGFTQSAAAVNTALDALEPTDEADNTAALRPLLSSLLAGTDESADRARLVTLITDRRAAPDELAPFPLTLRSVAPSTPPRNLGITRFTANRRADDPTQLRILVELLATTDNESTILTLAANGTEIERIPISLTDSRTARRLLTLPMSGGILTASLQTQDALAADNTASLVITPGRPLSVALIRRAGPIAEGSLRDPGWVLEETLRALPRVTLQTLDQARLASLPTPPDVLVFDALPAPPSRTTPALLLGSSRAPDAPSDRQSILLWDRADPLLTGLSLDGIFGVPTLVPSPVTTKPLARSSLQPLIWRTDQPRTIAVAFAPADSNWPLDVSFPVFIARSIEWLAGITDDARGSAFKPGDVIDLGDGPRRAPRAGLFTTTQGTPIAVNLTEAGESALPMGESSPEATPPPASGSGAVRKEIWSWFLAAAFVLLIAEWVVFAARTRLRT